MKKTFLISHDAIKPLHEKYEAAVKQASWTGIEKPPLDIEKFGCVIEQTFWASLTQEEGRFHNFSIQIEEPKIHLSGIPAAAPYCFATHISFEKLSKLSPALENTGNSFRVWFDEINQPYIHGFDSDGSSNLVIKSFSAGELLFCFPFPNVSKAILTGSRIEFIKNFKVFSDFFGQDKPKYESLLKRIANSMRNHGHGGTLLIVNQGSETNELDEYEFPVGENICLKDSIDNPNAPPTAYKALGCELQRHHFAPENPETLSIDELNKIISDPKYDQEVYVKNRIVNLLSQLTAIDGATIINSDFEVLGFGAKITVQEKTNEIEVTEPFENSEYESKNLPELGGTRHQSAARFVFNQKENALAIVASQDGKISVMYWDKEIEKVRVIQHAEYLFAGSIFSL
jgi:hypothetical protein